MIRELHLYDFDGTLFRSPDRPDWWGKGTWVGDQISLGRPCVPDKPGGDWWIGSVVSDAKQSIGDPSVWSIVCTGRANTAGGVRYRVHELLKQKGLRFDEVYLNTGGDTARFKMNVILGILRQFPSITTVQIWENNSLHLPAYTRLVEQLGLVAIPHLIKSTPHDLSCTEGDLMGLVSEGTAEWTRRTARLAQRWLRHTTRHVVL